MVGDSFDRLEVRPHAAVAATDKLSDPFFSEGLAGMLLVGRARGKGSTRDGSHLNG